MFCSSAIMPPMIICENVAFSYPVPDALPGRPVLCDVNFQVDAGAFVAIVGANGSGKSTLARHINALLVPDEGAVWIDGKKTADPTALWDIRKTAAMVFQNPDNQLVATTVEEDVAFGPENLGVPTDEIRIRVKEALAAVGMTDFARRAPHLLSGGQKQRVAIAGAFAMRPRIIVLDEATAMLDPVGRREVLQTARALNEAGMTVLFITHFMEEAAQAQRMLVMHEGRLVMDDTPARIFAQGGRLAKWGLEAPVPVALAQRLGVPNLLFTADLLANEKIRTAARAFSGVPMPLLEAPAKNEPILEAQGLTHIYAKGTAFEKKAITNISFTLHAGERVALIGHTGSGKSTLIQHFNGLLSPTSGRLVVRDGARVGMVFQQPEHQLFADTVYKDVAFGPAQQGITGSVLDEAACYALQAVMLPPDLWEKSPHALSGGQKRRAAIAGILAMNPDVLVMDEPTAGLDPRGREEILTLVEHIHRARGLTVVLVSHSMDDIARLCHRVMVMNNGEIALEGTCAEVFAQRTLLEGMGLTVPQVTEVLSRLGAAVGNAALEQLAGVYEVETAAALLGAQP